MIKKKNDSVKQNTDEEPIIDNEEIETLTNQLKRAVADYQNLEKRTEEAKRGWILSANKSLILKLLPVLDNLFLARKHITDVGLNLSVQKFLDVLKEDGVERIETENKEFNPATMECVSVQEGEENKVLEEVRPGFIINNETLRPAQVVVGRQQN